MIQTCGEVKHQETTLRRFHTDANFQQGEKWHVCGLESAETVARLSIRQAHTHTHTHTFSPVAKNLLRQQILHLTHLFFVLLCFFHLLTSMFRTLCKQVHTHTHTQNVCSFSNFPTVRCQQCVFSKQEREKHTFIFLPLWGLSWRH